MNVSVSKRYMSIIQHYEKCFEKYGDSCKGVDWPNPQDVDTRFRVMLNILNNYEGEVKLLDFGCGTANLYDYILRNKIDNIHYSGLDLSPVFVDFCKNKYPHLAFYCMDIIEDPDSLPDFDFMILNGVFTEKQDLSFDEMLIYFKTLLTILYNKSDRALAFNVMSKKVDRERADLFHLDQSILIDFLKNDLNAHFDIVENYGLYEYTTYLYK